MNIITLDLETFYAKDFSLTKLSYFDYINDPKFEVIGAGVKVNDGKPVWYSSHGNAIKEWLEMFDLENNAVIMHNAAFDAAILNWKWGIRPKVIFDTLSMARAIHGTDVGNSLSRLSTYYDLGVKGTEVINALGKHRNDFNSVDLAAYGEYCKQDCELTYKLFNKLAPHFNKTELQVIDMTIRMGTEPTMVLDETKLKEHLKDVVDFKTALLERAGATVDNMRSNLKFADALLDLGVDPPMKVSPTTGKETYAFAKTDEGFKALLEHHDERVRLVTEARMGVKTSLEESRSERLINVAKTGLPVPVNLKYYGCTTGRFSADQNLQFQNIPRESNMKKAISAPNGKVLVGVDLSNIELRVGLYFANEPAQLSLLAEGKDLYREFGSRIYDVPPEDISKDQRFISKACCLSLIYGVGAKTIQSNILKLGNIDIGEAEAVRIVKLYRESHKNVTNLWRSGEVSLSDIYLDIEGSFGNSSLVLPVHGKKGVLLPSGLYMAYPDIKNTAAQSERANYVYGKKEVKIYGPKVYQNCIAEGTLVLTDSGWKPIEKISVEDKVHDGETFVSHGGKVFQSVQACVTVDGVYMTPDHEVLTDEGWKAALEKPRPYRPNLWGIDSGKSFSQQREKNVLGFSLRKLRERYCEKRELCNAGIKAWGNTKLWMPIKELGIFKKHETWNEPSPSISCVGQYEATMWEQKSQSFWELWGARHNSLQGMGGIFRSFLGGYAGDLQNWTTVRSNRQQPRVLQRELSLGNTKAKCNEQEKLITSGYSNFIEAIGYRAIYHTQQIKVWLAHRKTINKTRCSKQERKVYDIVDCGPLSRFVVLGKSGPFIVHNCTQALARCVMTEAMVRISRKYKIVLIVHDQIIVEALENEAEAAYKFVRDEMIKAPKWAWGLPLDAEGNWGKTLADIK